jgi:predicted GNAT family acetyltransferase
VETHPAHRRQGYATAVWEEAKRVEPRLHHSDRQTEEGKAWADERQ